MTTNQILVGIGLILVLAVGSQVLASRLRIPALIVLLPVGFVAGALTTDVNPERLLGAAFEPLVSLSVAVILYDAGLGLDLRKLKGHTRRVVVRLIVLGVLITWAFGDVPGGAAAWHVTRGSRDARGRPRCLRADSRGPAAQLCPNDAEPSLMRASVLPAETPDHRPGGNTGVILDGMSHRTNDQEARLPSGNRASDLHFLVGHRQNSLTCGFRGGCGVLSRVKRADLPVFRVV